MYRVLIVDDEMPIREELLMFGFGNLGCVVCGQAENGQKALEFLQANPVDIIITDIRMPVMDGLRLIEVSRHRFPDIQYILLSCLNDFEPIQQALKLGVADYILKGTYTDNELATAILKTVANIEEQGKVRAERQRDNYRAAVRLLSRLISQEEAVTAETVDRLREFGVFGSYPCTAVWTDLRSDPSRMDAIIEELRSEYLSSPDFADSPGLYVCLPGGFLFFTDISSEACDGQSPAFGAALNLIESLYHKTRSGADGKTVCGSHFLLGPIGSNDDLARMVSVIEAFNEGGFYLNQGSTVRTAPLCRPLDDIDIDAIQTRLELTPIDSVICFLQTDLREFLLEGRIQRKDLHNFISSLMSKYMEGRLMVVDTRRLETCIHSAASLNELIDGIADCVSDSISDKKMNKTILHAIQFINQNLFRPLSLTIVAEHIGISSSYLSSLFFRETGGQFSEYVTQRRMEKAMELLRTSDYKVYEVSEMVGIQSYRYFSRLFKEYTGQAPRDFK